MDEFEWEKFLRESDKRSDRYHALWAKYRNHPDSESLIAREMGWSDGGSEFAESFDPLQDLEDMPLPVPNPRTRGIDWIQGREGHIAHPVAERARNAAGRLEKYCELRGMLNDDADEDLVLFISQIESLGAMLAGCLNGLAYDEQPDGGFIVAHLKRALAFVNETLFTIRRIQEKDLLDDARTEEQRVELLRIRQEILGLTQRFRSRPPA